MVTITKRRFGNKKRRQTFVSVCRRSRRLLRFPGSFVLVEEISGLPIVDPRGVAASGVEGHFGGKDRRIARVRRVVPLFQVPDERGGQGVGGVPSVH